MRQALGPGALGRPGGSGWRGRWEGGSGWGRHVNPMPFHFNVRPNSLQIKKKKKEMHLEMADFGMRKDNNTIINMFHKVNTV